MAGGGSSTYVFNILLRPDGRIFVAGQLGGYNGTNVNNIVSLNPDGTLDTSFNTTITDNQVYTLAFSTVDASIAVGNSPIIISPTGTNRIITSGGDEPLTQVVEYLYDGDIGGFVLTDVTTAASNETVGDVDGPSAFTGEVEGPFYSYRRLYLGSTTPFNAIKIKVHTVGASGASLTYSRVNANDTFTPLSNVQETISTLKNMRTTTEGIIYWDMPGTWELSEPTGNATFQQLYWVVVEETFSPPFGSGVTPTITRILKTSPP